MVTVPCWRLSVWKGHWVERSVHDTPEDALRAAARVERGVRSRIIPGTRKKAYFRQPDRPTEARRHREAIADAMVVRAQHMKLYKSSSNGTELATIPAEGVIK